MRRFPTGGIVRVFLREFTAKPDDQLEAQLSDLIRVLTDLAETDKVEGGKRTARKKQRWPSLSPQHKLYFRWSAVCLAKGKPGTTWKAAYRTASDRLKRTPYAGSPRTMKESYQIGQYAKRKRATDVDRYLKEAGNAGSRGIILPTVTFVRRS
jgi:hypothetical protein